MAAATGPVWLQLYVFRNWAISASLVQRAEAAGCKAVVLTVDVPMPWLSNSGTGIAQVW